MFAIFFNKYLSCYEICLNENYFLLMKKEIDSFVLLDVINNLFTIPILFVRTAKKGIKRNDLVVSWVITWFVSIGFVNM